MLVQQTVLISKKVKRVSLQRYLWSKIAYEEKATFRILGGLFLNQLWLESKAKTDEKFNKKFKDTLEVSSNILKELNIGKGLTPGSMSRLKTRAYIELEGFLVPKRNFNQWKSKFDSSVQLVYPKQPGVPTKKLPPERYIGIGYRDKGTAKNPAFDASPSWQDVAQSNQSLNREIEEQANVIKSAKSFNEITGALERLDKLWNLKAGKSTSD